jgi:NTE family protein
MPKNFESLVIKLLVVATNYLDRSEIVYRSGLMKPAVAGSMAIPGLFRPVEYGRGVLINGGAVNPLPYDLLFDAADIIIGVDVTFGGRSRARRMPSPLESMFGAAQIMQGAITEQKIRRRPPDILIRPRVEQFGLLDFFRAGQILRGADESKDELKTALHSLMKTFRAA